MRKVVGMAVLLVGLFVYVLAIMEVGARLIDTHWAVQAVFYLVAGVIWAFPLKPLMAWIQAPPRKR
jgi:hypothetical protein